MCHELYGKNWITIRNEFLMRVQKYGAATCAVGAKSVKEDETVSAHSTMNKDK
jgi:hypothetical protein